MAKFLIEVKEGSTTCEKCRFNDPDGPCKFGLLTEIDCTEFDLETLKITKEE